MNGDGVRIQNMPRKLVSLLPFSDSTKDLRLEPGPQVVKTHTIRLREGENTRKLAAAHVVALAESISVLGLLEPLVLDTRGRLLAGGHRLAALQLLDIEDSDRRQTEFLKRIDNTDGAVETKGVGSLEERLAFIDGLFRRRACPNGEVPVLVIDVNDGAGEKRNDLALAIEVAENSSRRPYTAREVQELAARLKAAGYKADAGRRKKGGMPTVKSVLQVALGRSQRTIERLIRGDAPAGKSAWENARITFLRAAKRLIAEGKSRRGKDDVQLMRAATTALQATADQGGSG